MKKRLKHHSKHFKEETEKVLQSPGISIWVNNYNDIFSSFDPRPYSQKALSDDFLSEIKKASIDKDKGNVELRFLIKKSERNPVEEHVIKKRLRKHFHKHFAITRHEINALIIKGASFTAFGIILMFLAALLLFKYNEATLLTSFLVILLEPAGWFLFWEGLDLVIFESKKIKPDLDFYEKMSKCKIQFLSY